MFKKAFTEVSTKIDSAKCQAETAFRSAGAFIGDTVDVAAGTIAKTIGGVLAAYNTLKYAGISVALVVAPVPTSVALAVIWMMELSFDSFKNSIDEQLQDNKRQREFDLLTHTLKKYGKIPKTSVVETPYLKMNIDALSGEITGMAKTGWMSWSKLEDTADGDLMAAAEGFDDPQSKKLVDAYISFRHKAALTTAQGDA